MPHTGFQQKSTITKHVLIWIARDLVLIIQPISSSGNYILS